MSELGSVYEFQSDISAAEKPNPLPIGEYRGSVKHAELKMSSTNKPMLVTTYNITSDQYPADYQDGNPDGETVSIYTSLVETPKSKWLLKQFGQMHGVSIANRLVATDFIGQEVVLKIEHEEYNGLMQPRAKAVRAV